MARMVQPDCVSRCYPPKRQTGLLNPKQSSLGAKCMLNVPNMGRTLAIGKSPLSRVYAASE